MVQSSTTNTLHARAELLSRMSNDYPAGTEISVLAVLPDGTIELQASQSLLPRIEDYYQPRFIREATAATAGQKRSYMTVSKSQTNKPNEKINNAQYMPNGLEEAGGILDVKSPNSLEDRQSPTLSNGQPRKKPCRGNATSMPEHNEGLVLNSQKQKQRKGSLSSTKAPRFIEKPGSSFMAVEQDLDEDWSRIDGQIEEEDGGDVPMMSEEEMVPLRIGDKKGFLRYLELRFVQLQQVDCKVVAKAWIKVIEPKKQSRNPYNGGDATKPYWWPRPVIHKEPDHLLKPDRIGVLIAILEQRLVPVDKLRAATDESPNLPPEKKALLAELYEVVELRNRLHQGLIDPNHIKYVQAIMGKHKGRRNARLNKQRLRKERSSLELSNNSNISIDENEETTSPRRASNFDSSSPTTLKEEEDAGELRAFHERQKLSERRPPVDRRRSTPGPQTKAECRLSTYEIPRANSIPYGVYPAMIEQESIGQEFFGENGTDTSGPVNLTLNSQVPAEAYNWGTSPASSLASPAFQGSQVSPPQSSTTPHPSSGYPFPTSNLGMDIDQQISTPTKQQNSVVNDIPILGPSTASMPYPSPQIPMPVYAFGDAYISYALSEFTFGRYRSLQEQLAGHSN